MKNFLISSVTVIILILFSVSGCKKDEVPIVATNSISEISGTTALCGGNITDDRGETVLSRGVCWSKNIEPSISDSKTSDGAGAGSYSSTVSNLLPATNYYIRAYATSSSGTGYGMVMSFETKGQAPATTPPAAINLSTTTAKLVATINANYLSTVVTFEYGTTSAYGGSVVAIQSPVTGNTVSVVTADITGLTAGTTYHYRVKAENSLGITYSEDKTFTMLGLVPASSTQGATYIGTTTATFAGSVNPNWLTTTVTFEYGTSNAFGSSVNAIQSPLSGGTASNVSANITGLTAGTTYLYRVKAENSLGITYSNTTMLTTAGALPVATTGTPSNLFATSVTLRGSVDANFLLTTITFEYGTSDAYGSTIIALQSPLSGSTATNVHADLLGLTAGTIYHYRLKAENSKGIAYGNDMIFTTLGQVPYASTQDAINLSSTSATLKGLVSAANLSTAVTFEYGTTTSYGTVINASPNIITGNNIQSVSASLSGLTTGTTYHFRVKAVNSLGTSLGADLTFVPTGASPVVDIDGNSYSVVNIGTQTWMAENLRTTKYNDNSNIPIVTANADWVALTSPAYCWYNNDESTYKSPYGALYNWYAVNSGKLCPAGWHVPSNTEFTVLTDYLGGISVAGGKLKETGNTKWASPNTGATNETGFGGVPGGQRDEAGIFIAFSMNSIFWSSTPYNIYKPWYRSLSYAAGSVFEGNGSLNIRGFSVRCIKD